MELEGEVLDEKKTDKRDFFCDNSGAGKSKAFIEDERLKEIHVSHSL